MRGDLRVLKLEFSFAVGLGNLDGLYFSSLQFGRHPGNSGCCR
jgi:hypothetical protein